MATLFFIVFVDLVGFGMIIPVLPFYAERLGTSSSASTAPPGERSAVGH